MLRTRKSPLNTFRSRQRRRGIVRVEIHVRKEDVALVRNVARALADPAREADTRALLRQKFVEPGELGLKALLAAAPLEGIDLTRNRDTGRPVGL
ncbi:MAG: hypothetical protein ACKVP5_16195 [Aestuariivirga sp.]